MMNEEYDDKDDDNIVFIEPNTILFYANVDEKTTMTLHKLLILFECKNHKKNKLRIFINSQGGCAKDGLACYDMIRNMPYQVDTIAIGICASAAMLILCAGDIRYATKNTVLLIHEASTAIEGNMSSISVDIDNAKLISRKYNHIYCKLTGLSHDKLLSLQKKDDYLTSKDAKRLGFIHNLY